MNRLFRLCSARRLIFFEPSSVHAGSARFVVPDKYQIAMEVGPWPKCRGGIEEEERKKERGRKEGEEEGRRKGERGKVPAFFFRYTGYGLRVEIGLGHDWLRIGSRLKNFSRRAQGSQARPASCLL